MKEIVKSYYENFYILIRFFTTMYTNHSSGFRHYKLVLVFILISLSHIASAQFRSATIGIDGLTCSMCSNSVEKLIRQLNFVEDVKMDLNNTTAQVFFRNGRKVDIHALAQKVFDSGFSVRTLQANFNVGEKVIVKEGAGFEYEGDQYILVKPSEKEIRGEITITFIGKKFLSKKEFDHWKDVVASHKGSAKGKSKVYHIVL